MRVIYVADYVVRYVVVDRVVIEHKIIIWKITYRWQSKHDREISILYDSVVLGRSNK